jgi:hypothetical protein
MKSQRNLQAIKTDQYKKLGLFFVNIKMSLLHFFMSIILILLSELQNICIK